MAQSQLAFESPNDAEELEHSPVERHFGRRLSDLVLAALTQAMKQGRDDIAERLALCGPAIEDDEARRGSEPRQPMHGRKQYR